MRSAAMIKSLAVADARDKEAKEHKFKEFNEFSERKNQLYLRNVLAPRTRLITEQE